MWGDYGLELVQPSALFALLALGVLGFFFVRSLVDFDAWQRKVSLAVRALLLLLLALAMAGLTLRMPTQEQFVIFALDRSLSVGDESAGEAEQFVRDALSHRTEEDVAFLDFGTEPSDLRTEFGVDEAPEDDPEAEVAEGDAPEHELLSVEEILERRAREEQALSEGTNLAAALEVAASSIPPFYVPHVVLLSDGNETDGDVLRSVLALNGVRVSTVPMQTRTDPEVQVSEVIVPAQVRQGAPFYVDVVVDSNHEDEGLVEVYRGAYRIASETMKLKAGENRFRFRQHITGERLAEYRVRIRDFEDTLLDNNTDCGLVFAEGKPRVLLVDTDEREARHLVRALEREDLKVELRPPEGVPTTLSDLQNFELVILSNVPATDVSIEQMDLIRTYVQDLGGGFLMLGGDQSFGLGGYYKTSLEEVLPVRSDFEQEKEKPSLAMVLIIDKSGSMGGAKIELAKDAAKAAAELLGPRDRIGVIAFDGSPNWVCEVRPCTDRNGILNRIAGVEAGGGTNMAPAMEEGYLALQKTVAKLKHVILLTDGQSAPGDFEGIATRMSAARITVSTVGLGDGAHQELLERIAKIGNGRYYFSDDARKVPQIFAKETMTASKSGINEDPFLPQLMRPTPALESIDLDAAPFLMGYVVTRPKPTSEVILATENGDPLLVWWRHGLGRAGAFTSDAKSRWAADWLTWPAYSQFWAQVCREVMRTDEAKGVMVSVDRDGTDATVTVDAIDENGSFVNRKDTKLRLLDPGLDSTEVEMEQVAPGRYRASVSTAQAGAWHLEVTQGAEGRVQYRESRGLVVGFPEELRLRPTNETLLRSVSELSGGTYDPEPTEVFSVPEVVARKALPLWPYLLAAAAVLFLIDVALRRLDLAGLGRRIGIGSEARS